MAAMNEKLITGSVYHRAYSVVNIPKENSTLIFYTKFILMRNCKQTFQNCSPLWLFFYRLLKTSLFVYFAQKAILKRQRIFYWLTLADAQIPPKRSPICLSFSPCRSRQFKTDVTHALMLFPDFGAILKRRLRQVPKTS